MCLVCLVWGGVWMRTFGGCRGAEGGEQRGLLVKRTSSGYRGLASVAALQRLFRWRDWRSLRLGRLVVFGSLVRVVVVVVCA